MPVKLQPEVRAIAYGSPLHDKIANSLRDRKMAGRRARSKRAEFWAKAEELFQAYIPETDLDAKKRALKETGIPQYTTVTIPYAYATLMTMHTYFSSVFLSRQPVMQVQGRHGESVSNEQALETLLDYQMVVGSNLIPLYVWLMDMGKYGEGIIGEYWDEDVNLIPQVVEVPETFMGFDVASLFGGGKKMKKVQQLVPIVNYKGNKYFNIKPKDFYHDPTVILSQLQMGEFVGWHRLVSMNYIKRRENNGYYFNTDKIKAITRTGDTQLAQSNTDTTPQNDFDYALLSGTNPTGALLDEIVVELSPREWGLAARDNLEKWAFTWANEDVIIGCQPLGLFHNKFPVDIGEYEVEGYNLSKRGMLEIVKPLNDTLDWLFNTHFYNVRKALNNEWIYDPSVLNQRDVERPGPGKLVRVRPERYGSDVSKSFYQVPVMDVTQNHIRDAQLIVEMMQRLTGVNDSVMGVLGNNRRTATEVRTSSSFAVNRLKTLCEYISSMAFGPLTQKSIANTQQLYDGQQEFRIRGADGRQVVRIDPAAIGGAYDYVPVDGTMPIDRMAQAQMFGQLMQQMAQFPPIAQRTDFLGMFSYLAKNLLNVKNFDSFMIKANVQPQQAIQQQVQAGNLVPAQPQQPVMAQ